MLLGTIFFVGAKNMKVEKKVLANGLTVLVNEVENLQRVSVQIKYHVGSKDEKDGERGLAHLLEHMIFKGTEELLSEPDIAATIGKKLGGTLNAATSNDYTVYYCDLPRDYWWHALPIFADCMRNCSFKEDHLNSEFKAVVQELKMGRDNYKRSLILKMLEATFAEHPYHYPTIGYKHDVWAITRENLLKFYKKHYVPNNATLVVVGPVAAVDVFAQAEKYFSAIPKDETYKKKVHYHTPDLMNKSVLLYRDIQQPYALICYVVPGAGSGMSYVSEIVQQLLWGGKSSRLYKKLVDEKKLVNSLEPIFWEFFDYAPWMVGFEPKNIHDIDEISAVIQHEIDTIIQDGVSAAELDKAARQLKSGFYALLEDNNARAGFIANYFLAMGDENYISNYIIDDKAILNQKVKEYLSAYCTTYKRHQGIIAPVREDGKKELRIMQENSDRSDEQFLSARQRQSELEPEKYTNSIRVSPPQAPALFKPEEFTLSSGLKVMCYARSAVPKIQIILKLKASAEYDSEKFSGLYSMMSSMMLEGTKNYPGALFAQEYESYGMEIEVVPGFITMSLFSSDLEKGLALLQELVTNAAFDESRLDIIKDRARSRYLAYLDSPQAVAHQLIREHLYKGHPYSKCSIANETTIEQITAKDLRDFYRTVMTPCGAKMVIVGDFSSASIKNNVERSMGSWRGVPVKELVYPAVCPINANTIFHDMNRDQVVMGFAAVSINRLDKDFDKFLLFDQVFSAGMSSRLFNLREKHGIFYGYRASSVTYADEQPGLFSIVTQVSHNDVKAAEELFIDAIKNGVDTITEQEIESAKNTLLLEPIISSYATNASIAKTLLFFERYQLPVDYFAQRAERLAKITIQEVKEAVKKILRPEAIAQFRVGRI
jgi:zinc protease